jgi:hypothetical protein
MSHGISILEMARKYEAQAKGFKNITTDIMKDDSQYYGVLNVGEDFDLLFCLYSHERDAAVMVQIYRGFPSISGVKHEADYVIVYLSKALRMFPEIIKKVKFIKEKWPTPYDNKTKKEGEKEDREGG